MKDGFLPARKTEDEEKKSTQKESNGKIYLVRERVKEREYIIGMQIFITSSFFFSV